MAPDTMDSRDARKQWRDIMDKAHAGGDTVIERYGKPTAAVIPFEDYQALLDELDDLRAGRRAQATLEAWQENPSLARPYADIRAELVKEGLLDE